MELNGWTSPQILTRYGASARSARARRTYDRPDHGHVVAAAARLSLHADSLADLRIRGVRQDPAIEQHHRRQGLPGCPGLLD